MKKLIFLFSLIVSFVVISILQKYNVFNYFSENKIANVFLFIATIFSVFLIFLLIFAKQLRKGNLEKEGFYVFKPFYIFPNKDMILQNKNSHSVVFVNKNYKKIAKRNRFDIMWKLCTGIYSVKLSIDEKDCGLINNNLSQLTERTYKSISMFDNHFFRLQVEPGKFQVFNRSKLAVVSECTYSRHAILTLENEKGHRRKIYCFKHSNNNWHVFDVEGNMIENDPIVNKRIITLY